MLRLPAVGLFDDVVHGVGATRDQTHRDEPALGIAELRVLDLDHVRAPVGEDGSCRRDERPRGDLDDFDP